MPHESPRSDGLIWSQELIEWPLWLSIFEHHSCNTDGLVVVAAGGLDVEDIEIAGMVLLAAPLLLIFAASSCDLICIQRTSMLALCFVTSASIDFVIVLMSLGAIIDI